MVNSAVFLDRDGVINAALYNPLEGKLDSPYSFQDFRLLPGAAQAIREINRLDLPAVVISNQPGVAKGKCDLAFLRALNYLLHRELAREGAHLDGIYYCLHHPQAQVESLRASCDCRKPRPGLLLRAARELGIDLASSYMVGDLPTDVAAGRAAGCRTILLSDYDDRPANGHPPDFVTTDLAAAVRVIAERRGSAWRSSWIRPTWMRSAAGSSKGSSTESPPTPASCSRTAPSTSRSGQRR
jgi:D-glycero-D-manno-heptose 1,7-bisphosphate phosphatase